jgi:hypothetical protein
MDMGTDLLQMYLPKKIWEPPCMKLGTVPFLIDLRSILGAQLFILWPLNNYARSQTYFGSAPRIKWLLPIKFWVRTHNFHTYLKCAFPDELGAPERLLIAIPPL